MREIPIYQIDAFTQQPFRGNSAAIALVQPEHLPLHDGDRQLMAAENNLAETAFVELLDHQTTFSKAVEFRLRWFTPTREVPLCGHATLASAACLMYDLRNPATHIVFHTLSGPLKVSRGAVGEGDIRAPMVMSLPLIEPDDPLPAACDTVESPLIKALCPGFRVMRILFTKRLKYLLIVCDNTRQELEDLQPNIGEADACSTDDEIVGVIVSLLDGNTICSRFFAPWAGISEDPVTGSAHSVLAAHYCAQTKRQSLAARQCSNRSGDLRVTVNHHNQTVDVVGHAVTTIKGTMFVP